MKAEIIAIGSELLTSDRMDSNSLYLTEKLNSIGIDLNAKFVVGDDEASLEQVLRDSLQRVDFVFATGGLGPTEDDITRKVFARVFQKPLVLDEEILRQLEERFRSRGLTMTSNNARQALVPSGARVLENSQGTAPGLWIESEGKHAIMLPGPPHEMKAMFESQCLARLAEMSKGVRIQKRVFKLTGLTESSCDARIAPIYTRYRNPVTTILASPGEIEIHLKATGPNEEEAESLLNELGDKIEMELGDHIFSRRGESLEQIVGMYLTMRQASVAVAESCTGGLVSERLTRIPGSSAYFVSGVVCYSNAAKTELADVPPLLIEMNGAVSREVAIGLAEGIRKRAETTFGIGVTGIAGPAGGSEAKPVGLVHLAVSSETGVDHREVRFPGDRQRVRWWASQLALDMLRRKLL
ncbi:MAG: competence/damage-inducible protein A [Acidobacteriia bacterium]|nr:competence/damage-inducible protein A [Terriglobia bacterium]